MNRNQLNTLLVCTYLIGRLSSVELCDNARKCQSKKVSCALSYSKCYLISKRFLKLFSPNFILIYFCVHFPFGHYVTTYIMLVSDGHMTTAKTDHHVFSSVVL